MIRPVRPEDTPRLLKLTEGTGVFKPRDIQALREVLDDFHAENHAHDHYCVTYERDGQVIGYAYYALASMTDRTWYLWWIAVDKQTQSRGVGKELLRYVEDEARKRNGRVLFIETSSVPAYEPTRQFYLRTGYDQEAVLRDLYADGDSMVVFRKRLEGPEPTPKAG
jgi:GNAT superfamily N-acetyltransferase